MKIHMESRDFRNLFTKNLEDAVNSGPKYKNRHGQSGLDAVRVDELEFWKSIVYGAMDSTGLRPWSGAQLLVPQLSKECNWGTYTYGKFNEQILAFVGKYWSISIATNFLPKARSTIVTTRLIFLVGD